MERPRHRVWRRTTIGIQRELTKTMGIGSSHLADHARVSYAKVVECQDRGLVHLHVVIRLDGPSGPAEQSPAELTIDRFEAAVVAATKRAREARLLSAVGETLVI